MNIVLIGFMGAGKSRVGRELSQKLNRPLFDTDDMIERQVGASIATIILSQGEEAFRKLERDAIKMVALSRDAVISTGGGVPLNPENWGDLKKNGTLVWLKASLETILDRIKKFQSRPLIDSSDPIASMEKKLKEREPVYSKADFIIDTDTLTVDQIVDQIRVKVLGAKA